MTGGGRTVWWSKDAGWWRRGRIVKLGRRFGPAGPAVLDWLTSEAKSQGPKRGHDGTVKSDYDAVAYGCFIEADLAEEIVQVCVQIGALDDFELSDSEVFTCRISGWDNDIEKPLDATRKAAERAEKGATKPNTATLGQSGTNRDNGGHVPERPAESPTGQDRTRQTSSLRSDVRDVEFSERVTDSLRPVAENVHARLSELSVAKGAEPPTLRRVGDLIADFPDHDHNRLVADVADYWLHGNGARTRRKDFARVYRDWVARKPATGTVTLLPVRDGLSEGDRMALVSRRRNDAADLG